MVPDTIPVASPIIKRADTHSSTVSDIKDQNSENDLGLSLTTSESNVFKLNATEKSSWGSWAETQEEKEDLGPEKCNHEHTTALEEGVRGNPPDLPPADGGRNAWIFLIIGFVVEYLVWGMPFSYGVFLAYYERVWPGQTTILAQVGTVSLGIMNLCQPPLAFFIRAHPRLRAPCMWLGTVLLGTGLLSAAFTTQPYQLIVTQGVLFSSGGLAVYVPLTNYMFEWWIDRRGFATGVIAAGCGMGGLTLPFITSALLNRFGMKTTFIAYSVVYCVVLGVAITYLRRRLPLANVGAQQAKRTNWMFLRGRSFWLIGVGVFLQALGTGVPMIFLPTFAEDINLGSTIGTISVALLNLASIPALIICGILVDKGSTRALTIGVATGSSLSVFLLWGLSTHPACLLVFSICYGFIASSYCSLFPRFASIVAGNDPTLPHVLYALFYGARGLGSIISGPITTRLLKVPSRLGVGSYAVDGYGWIIIFTGAVLAMSVVGVCYKEPSTTEMQMEREE